MGGRAFHANVLAKFPVDRGVARIEWVRGELRRES